MIHRDCLLNIKEPRDSPRKNLAEFAVFFLPERIRVITPVCTYTGACHSRILL